MLDNCAVRFHIVLVTEFLFNTRNILLESCQVCLLTNARYLQANRSGEGLQVGLFECALIEALNNTRKQVSILTRALLADNRESLSAFSAHSLMPLILNAEVNIIAGEIHRPYAAVGKSSRADGVQPGRDGHDGNDGADATSIGFKGSFSNPANLPATPETGDAYIFTGETTTYGLFYTQERGTLFVGSQVPVYAGQICGENSRPGDIVCNVCRKKHVTNTRNSSAAEESMRLVSVHPLTLEECMEFIDDDELLEITPKSLRMRKRTLSHELRAKAASRGLKI